MDHYDGEVSNGGINLPHEEESRSNRKIEKKKAARSCQSKISTEGNCNYDHNGSSVKSMIKKSDSDCTGDFKTVNKSVLRRVSFDTDQNVDFCDSKERRNSGLRDTNKNNLESLDPNHGNKGFYNSTNNWNKKCSNNGRGRAVNNSKRNEANLSLSPVPYAETRGVHSSTNRGKYQSKCNSFGYSYSEDNAFVYPTIEQKGLNSNRAIRNQGRFNNYHRGQYFNAHEYASFNGATRQNNTFAKNNNNSYHKYPVKNTLGMYWPKPKSGRANTSTYSVKNEEVLERSKDNSSLVNDSKQSVNCVSEIQSDDVLEPPTKILQKTKNDLKNNADQPLTVLSKPNKIRSNVTEPRKNVAKLKKNSSDVCLPPANVDNQRNNLPDIINSSDIVRRNNCKGDKSDISGSINSLSATSSDSCSANQVNSGKSKQTNNNSVSAPSKGKINPTAILKCADSDPSGGKNLATNDSGNNEKGDGNPSTSSSENCNSSKDKQKSLNSENATDDKRSNTSAGDQPGEKRNNSNSNPRKKKKPKKEPVLKTYWIALDDKQSFDEQAISMIRQFELTDCEMVNVDHLLSDLKLVFSLVIYNVKPVVFGSVVAGTAFKNSDVDVYLECYGSLPEDNVREFIIRKGSIMWKKLRFKEVVKIATARVPIIKAVHILSGIHVDVSFKTDRTKCHYGLRNSILVRHLCLHDLRVKNLIMLVLFWAKFHNFVGKLQFSSFTFILMVIFYLQNVEILPPLHSLIVAGENEESWPTLFSRDISLLYNSNTESLESLYIGFFRFYSAVRFNEVVISVFAGELILGVLFDSMEMLPECYTRYRQIVTAEPDLSLERKNMCVQEPFNLSLNTVRGVSDKTIEMLNIACQNVCSVFSKFSPQRALPIIHSDLQTYEDEEDIYTWQLPCPPDDSPSEWFKKITEATKTIFKSILLMDLNKSDKPNAPKFCEFIVPHETVDNPVHLNMSCEYYVATKERNDLFKAYHSLKISEFEKHVKASSLHAEDLKKKNKKTPFPVSVWISKHEFNGSVEVYVNSVVIPGKAKKHRFHRQFVSYLRNENFKNFLTIVLELTSVNKVDQDKESSSSDK